MLATALALCEPANVCYDASAQPILVAWGRVTRTNLASVAHSGRGFFIRWINSGRFSASIINSRRMTSTRGCLLIRRAGAQPSDPMPQTNFLFLELQDARPSPSGSALYY